MSVLSPETSSMWTPDGVRLDADIYRSAGKGPFPVLLMRQPYGRRIASTICYAHPSWYADQGYIVVIQDVRGRGTSEGVFRLFADDEADGADAVNWAASLPDSSGRVGMYGFSYQGTNQLLAAASRPAPLRALAPAMIGWSIGRDWAYENDAFCLAAGLGWATQIGAETARLVTLRSLARLAPYPFTPSTRRGQITFGASAIIRTIGIGSTTRRTVAYWRHISPAFVAAAVKLPMLFIGGWYDSHLPGTMTAFKHFAATAPRGTNIVVGPWAHFPWTRVVGGYDFGPEAVTTIDRLQIRWFNHWLRGENNGMISEPPIRLFDMGEQTWRDLAAWPEKEMTFYLAGGGRASIDVADGKLGLDRPSHEVTDFMVHDPWRPVPAIGGPYGAPAGPADRSVVDHRPDVLTFTTEPLRQPITLAGDVSAELWLRADAPSFDVSCVLSRVDAEGQAVPVAQGYRLTRPEADLGQGIEVSLRATCVTIKSDERLRLSIAASCFPAYPVNPGTGQYPTATSMMHARIITLGVRHGGERASRLRVNIA